MMKKTLILGSVVLSIMILIMLSCVFFNPSFKEFPQKDKDTTLVNSFWKTHYEGLTNTPELQLEEVLCKINLTQSDFLVVETSCPTIKYINNGQIKNLAWHGKLSLDLLIKFLSDPNNKTFSFLTIDNHLDDDTGIYFSQIYLNTLSVEEKALLANAILSIEKSTNIITPEQFDLSYLHTIGKPVQVVVHVDRTHITPEQVAQLSALTIFKVMNLLMVKNHPPVFKYTHQGLKLLMSDSLGKINYIPNN